MNTFFTKNKKPILIAVIILVIIIILILLLSGGKKTPTGTTEAFQQQIENSKDLKQFVESERNDFEKGTYSLDKKASKIDWSYDGMTGSIPVDGGTLSVRDTGRIEGFTVDYDTKNLTANTAGVADAIKKAISGGGNSKGSMISSMALPNSVDDAFSVSLNISAGQKATSVSVGMFVKNAGDNITVSGDVTLDAKSVGVQNPKGYLVLKPTYVFSK
jgi:hypothetical protein